MNPRLIKRPEKLEKEGQSRDMMAIDDLRAYLIERRRSLLTELDALNRLLKHPPRSREQSQTTE